MSGWAAFQSATTLSSTFFCSGASPPPRQQYQRSSTGAPPADVVDDGASDAALGASVAAALAAPPPCDAGAADGAELPHAPASNAVAAIRPSALIRSMAPPGGLRRVVIVTRPRGRADGLIQIGSRPAPCSTACDRRGRTIAPAPPPGPRRRTRRPRSAARARPDRRRAGAPRGTRSPTARAP